MSRLHSATATLPDINKHYADLGHSDLNEIYRILNKDDRWVLFMSGGGIRGAALLSGKKIKATAAAAAQFVVDFA
jgi:hypothetical protein